MRKQVYPHPVMRIVKIQQSKVLCDSVTSISGNAGLGFSGGGTGPARGREDSGDWEYCE